MGTQYKDVICICDIKNIKWGGWRYPGVEFCMLLK